MRRKTKQLEKIIAADTNISPSFPKLHFWQSPRFLIDALTCTIEPDFFPLAFAICLTLKGWNLQFWNQNSKNNDINRHEETKNWFKERGVEVKDIPQYDGNVWRLEYEGQNSIQPYDTDSENIKILILDIWKRLNKNTNSTIEQKD